MNDATPISFGKRQYHGESWLNYDSQLYTLTIKYVGGGSLRYIAVYANTPLTKGSPARDLINKILSTIDHG